MPFTISHVAAVWPLRRFVNLSACVIGSMVPDFTYMIYTFFGVFFESHSLNGLLLYCFPAGVFFCLVNHYFSQAYWNLRFPWLGEPAKFFPVTSTIIGLLIGASLHIVWDQFTHRYGLIVKLWPNFFLLRFQIFGVSVVAYNFFQHMSSLLGLIVVFFWISKRMKLLKCIFCNMERKRFTFLVGIFLLFFAVVSFFSPTLNQDRLDFNFSPHNILVDLAFRGLFLMAGFYFLLPIFVAAFRFAFQDSFKFWTKID
jgi:hypothetical protein